MHPFTQLFLPAGAAAVHWFEQASFALTDGPGTLLLVDPYAPHERPAERFIHTRPPLDEAQWPPHFVLFTHAHDDHTNSETVARIHAAAPRARYLGPQESIDQIVAETAVDAGQCSAVVPGQRVSAGTMAVNVVYAKPPDGDPDAGIAPPDTPHFGYVVEAGALRIYLSGDPINTFANHAFPHRGGGRAAARRRLLHQPPHRGRVPLLRRQRADGAPLRGADSLSGPLPVLRSAQL